MTIKDCIDIVDNIKPNQYTIKDKVMWLSFIDEIIINEVLKTHEGYDGRYDDFEGYSEDKLSVTLIVPSPYDKVYPEYLKMQIDKENGEIARYNNSMTSYNTYMTEFRKYYNKTHMPLDTTKKTNTMPPKTANVGLMDAEYENIKKDLTYILTEYFSDSVSADKLYSIVNSFVQNNIEMLKGKPGYTPIKGVDYWNEIDQEEIRQFALKKVDETMNSYAKKTDVSALANKVAPSPASVTLYADRWEQTQDESRWHQEVVVANATITPYSKVDLQLSSEQIMIFYEKDLAFVTENDGGVVTVFCIGQVPENDYVIQATVSEVVVNG